MELELYIRFLLYQYFQCWKYGRLVHVELFVELLKLGINPEDLEIAFDDGVLPSDFNLNFYNQEEDDSDFSDLPVKNRLKGLEF